ncbi:MAG: DUF5060 domain-containing protein [Acidobacteria bacterium]|nr:DUF5060 domain-containing protein [Acidobacteriota bacterium]
MRAWMLVTALGARTVAGQQTCPPTPTYSPCELVFELNEQEAAAHRDPYQTVELRAELRSPRAKTILMPGYWDGGRRLVIRFTPVDPGAWDFRITSNIERFNGKQGQMQATDSPDPGFLLPANVHHWMASESRKPHLWMGDTFLEFGTAPQQQFDAYAEARAKQKFTHVRGLLVAGKLAFPGGRPEAAYFQQLDSRILALNRKGMFVDLVVASGGGQLTELFPGWQERERLARYIVSRYSAFHITWQLLGEFESHDGGRALLKELGVVIQKHDPYQHPRSTGTLASSAAASPDGWMNYVVHHAFDDTVGAVEHQVFPAPFVNTGFAAESAAGADAFRKRLWQASMNGQYPAGMLDIQNLDSAGAKAAKAWYEFFARTRYWELEPYFDVDGARALALPGVEYILYIERPGPVEILIEKHTYDVFWMNPATGETTKEKKDFKGSDRWTGEPPSKTQDWVLHLSREGRKEGMLRSYKFESRPNLMQEIEQNPQKAPFDILEPSRDVLSLKTPSKYQAKLRRETRGTRQMMYLWTGEVPTEGRGYRVVGTGAEGTLSIPPDLARQFPAVFNLRIYALNAVGKVYAVDKVYRLTE